MKRARRMGLHPRHDLSNPTRRCVEATIRHGEQFISSTIADRGAFWWNERKPDQPSLWESKIELGEKFFNEILVPVAHLPDLRAPQRITWRQVYRQFGVDPDKASDKQAVKFFRRRILRELKKIKLAWPELNYSTAKGVLILSPSKPAIPRLRLVE